MALVADQQDVEVVLGEAPRLVVHLRDQRAGRVDGLEVALLGLAVHLGRDAVGREDHGLPGRHLVELLDEDRAARLEVGDDVLVVHDLLAHVDRGAVQVQRLLDGHHGPVDAGAVAARRRQEDGLVGLLRRQDERRAQIGGHASSLRTGDGRAELSVSRHRVTRMALETSPQAPAPVRQIANAISGWVDRLGAVWVEGQVAQVSRRPGLQTVFLTLRDSVADISVPVTCSRLLFDGLNPPLVEGASVLDARQAVLLRQPRHPLAPGPRDPDGRARRAARPARAPAPAARRRGPVRGRAASGRCRSCRTGSA